MKNGTERMAAIRLLRSFRAADRGTSAIEFALAFPILLLLLFGTIEFTRVVNVQRGVSQIASATGDLVARADDVVPIAEVQDIMTLGRHLLGNAPRADLTIQLSGITSSATNATRTTEQWRCIYSGSTDTTACTCPRSLYALTRPGLVTLNDSVVIATATYGYKPLGLHKGVEALSTVFGQTLRFRVTRYLKPRNKAVQLRMADQSLC